MTRTDVEHFHRMVDMLPSDPPPRDIAAYLDAKRVLPASTPYPGRWQTSRVEYFREVFSDMNIWSPVQHEVVVAAAQTGKTSCMEGVAAFYMDCVPSEILYVAATQDLCERWAVSRLPFLIESLGFKHKIVAQSGSSTSRRSGDRVYRKEGYGFALDIVSAQSAASLRASSKRLLLRDEVSGCKIETNSGEGSWLSISEARTIVWGNRRKILDCSTPAVYGSCAITKLFEQGDQRVWKVPCPRCGFFQELVMGNAQARVGLVGEYKEGKLLRAVYLCARCHQIILNYEKAAMNAKGRWEPTATSQSPYFVSRRISALPSLFITWNEIMQKYNESHGDPEQERAFANLILGQAFQETGARPEMRHVVELRSNYKEGVVQPEALFLVAGGDVQRGSAIDPATGKPKDPDNPPGIYLEVLGIARGHRTASVAYLFFGGFIEDAYAGAWRKLEEFIVHGGRDGAPGLVFFRADGRPFQVRQVLIDSGEGLATPVVYDFCFNHKLSGINPVKGYGFLKSDKRRAQHGDVAGPQFFRKWSATNIDAQHTLYTISTNHYKSQLYGNLKIKPTLDDPNPYGLAKFPYTYSDRYFEQLCSEVRMHDGSYHPVGGARQEAIDARVYALAAGDIFLANMVTFYRLAAQRGGNSPQYVQGIDTNVILDKLEAEAGIAPVNRMPPDQGGTS